jgi:hypothetical protein
MGSLLGRWAFPALTVATILFFTPIGAAALYIVAIMSFLYGGRFFLLVIEDLLNFGDYTCISHWRDIAINFIGGVVLFAIMAFSINANSYLKGYLASRPDCDTEVYGRSVHSSCHPE